MSIENEIAKRSSWYEFCSFYADNQGHISENGIYIYLDDVTFFCKGPDFETSFKAIDVLYTDRVLKSHVLEYLDGKRSKVRRTSVFTSFGAETLTCIELADRRLVFIKLKDMAFKQLLSVAQAKQKYSKTVADRN